LTTTPQRETLNPESWILNPGPGARAYSWFKAAVFVLLALNTGIFLRSGTFSEGLDSIAWLTLLALFELETGWGKLGRTPFLANTHSVLRDQKKGPEKVCVPFSVIAAVHGARFAALAAVGAAAAGFLYNNDWLDAANSMLWIAVVALLELEIRRPATVVVHRARFTAAAATLYSGLGALVLVWLWRGEWFDAYDAALWLVAFATIEINVLRYFQPGVYAETSAPEPR
jgi:hypothetical protein